jgi:hypothetical protein
MLFPVRTAQTRTGGKYKISQSKNLNKKIGGTQQWL